MSPQRCSPGSRWRGQNAHMRNNRLGNYRIENACTVRSQARGEACLRVYLSHICLHLSATDSKLCTDFMCERETDKRRDSAPVRMCVRVWVKDSHTGVHAHQ